MAVYRTLKYPPAVFWEVTSFCNHNCVHCFNYWRSDAEARSCPRTSIDPADYMKIAAKIAENKPARVVFTGGEPLAVWDHIQPVIEYLQENKISISFNTNAALMTQERAEYFASHRIGMFISFPSVVPEEFDRIVSTPGAFDRVIQAADLCKQAGVRISFNMVVSRLNLNSIFETAKFLKERYQVDHISITRVSEPINAIDRFDEYMLTGEDFKQYLDACCRVSEELNMATRAASPITPCSVDTQEAFDLFAFAGGCEAGKTSYVITAEGKVRACARDSKEYGDFLTEPFSEIWERMAEWRDESMIPAECGQCNVRSMCRGGCRVDQVPRQRRYNCLDAFSDLKRLPLAFQKEAEYLPRWNYETYFQVPEYLRFVEEDFCVRISYRGQYVFCTREFSQYLDGVRGTGFKMDDFCNLTNMDLDTARRALSDLYKKGIVMPQDI